MSLKKKESIMSKKAFRKDKKEIVQVKVDNGNEERKNAEEREREREREREGGRERERGREGEREGEREGVREGE